MHEIRAHNLKKYWGYDCWLLDETIVLWLSKEFVSDTTLHRVRCPGF
jgi:hypothetical protein